jgi:hypothetical protein
VLRGTRVLKLLDPICQCSSSGKAEGTDREAGAAIGEAGARCWEWASRVGQCG